MMKKLLSLLLALALTLSLAAPALADETQAPLWQQAGYPSLEEYLDAEYYTEAQYYAYDATPAEQKSWLAAWLAAHPGGADGFDADAYFAAEYYGYDGKADYMEHWGLATQEEFYNDLLCSWIADGEQATWAQDQWAALQADQPQRTALFLTQVDQYVKDDWGYDSLTALLADGSYFSSREEAYLYLFDSWNDSWAYAQEVEAERSARLTVLGGVPGQYNVLVNGKCLAFGARAPKLIDGVLSVPADLLQKTLGVLVKGNADGYAPLRGTAEAAGWEVLWDQEYQTAVLVDTAAQLADLQGEFSQADALFTRLLELGKQVPGQSYRTDSSAELALTLFDTLNGDKTYSVKLRGEALARDGALSATLTVDAASLLGLVTAEQVKALFGDSLSLSKLKELAQACKIELIFDPQEEMLYLRAPALAQLTGGKVPALGQWISVDLGGLLAPQTTELPQLSALLSSLIYSQALSETSYGYWASPIDFYDHLKTIRAQYVALMGNGRFTEKNGTLTYSLDAKTVNALLRDSADDLYGAAPMGDLFKACDFTLSLNKDGRLNMDVNVESDYGQMGDYGPFAALLVGNLRYRATASATAGSYQSDMELHWQNHLKLTCDAAAQTRPVGDAPPSAPPKTDLITPLEDLDDLLYDAGYEALYYLLP